MKRYLMSAVAGMVFGVFFLAASSCVEKKSVVEVVDAGVTGAMEVGVPTISSMPAPVNSQITDAVTQSKPVVTMPEQK